MSVSKIIDTGGKGYTEEEKLQALREKGFRMFVEDMNNGGYPESKHEIKMDSIEFEKFQEKIK